MTETRNRDAVLRMAEIDRVAPFRLRDADGMAAGEGDGRTLDGYASVFNSITIIDSWEGRFKEQFLSGSMKKSFRERTPIIQFDHGRHPMIGSLPVAAFDAGFPREETDPELAPDGGAHVVAQLHQSSVFEPVREVISTGTVNGMSIRFAPVRERWYRPDGTQVKDEDEIWVELLRTWIEDVPDDELLRRDIVEASVAEMGPVVWPAYLTTSVGVRSLPDSIDRKALIQELAVHLREHPEITKDLIAASEPERSGGEQDDAEDRQAGDASARKQRAAARSRDLALLGII